MPPVERGQDATDGRGRRLVVAGPGASDLGGRRRLLRLRHRPVPCQGSREIADPESVAAEVIAAAPTFAFPGLPSEIHRGQPIAAEQRRGHPDMGRIIPVPRAAGHLAGAIGSHGREAGPPRQALHQPGHALRTEDHVVVQIHQPGGRPQPLRLVPRPGDGLPSVGVIRPRRTGDAMHADLDPALDLKTPRDVGPRRRQVAAQEDEVDGHQGAPARPTLDRVSRGPIDGTNDRSLYPQQPIPATVAMSSDSALTAAVTPASWRWRTGAASRT